MGYLSRARVLCSLFYHPCQDGSFACAHPAVPLFCPYFPLDEAGFLVYAISSAICSHNLNLKEDRQSVRAKKSLERGRLDLWAKPPDNPFDFI
jgi:hypothetical protein